jgi:hypothetical protein
MNQIEGLLDKYIVWSNDDYRNVGWCFVLDLDHDQFATQAMYEWQRSFRAANPWLKNFQLTQKQTVERKTPSAKHRHCNYWVLEPAIDPHAIPALKEYIRLCEHAGYKALGADLRAKIAEFKAGLLVEAKRDNYLYIFEDGTLAQARTEPTENDKEAVDEGILNIVRIGVDGFEEYDPYDMWLLVDRAEIKTYQGDPEPGYDPITIHERVKDGKTGSGDEEGSEEDDQAGSKGQETS